MMVTGPVMMVTWKDGNKNRMTIVVLVVTRTWQLQVFTLESN